MKKKLTILFCILFIFGCEKQGDHASQYKSAVNYIMNNNREKGFEIIKSLSDQGYAEAQLYLGKSKFGKTDEEEGLKLIIMAAEQGLPAAQNTLGGLYSFGIGGAELDLNKAVEWYGKACDNDYFLSCNLYELKKARLNLNNK